MSAEENTKHKYHHGDLADALVDATLTLLARKGPALLSLREVARVAGVSHGAPAHHFGDKAGLLTAVALQGHQLLAERLSESQVQNQSSEARLQAAGEAYIRFAVTKPAHFSIMFQPDLINPDDPAYRAAGAASFRVLESCVRALLSPSHGDDGSINATVVALWSQVHGFASLWLAGNFGDPDDLDLLETLIEDTLTSLKR